MNAQDLKKNPAVAAALAKLDVNRDGKVNVADAEQVINEQLAKQKPSLVAGGAFIAGIVVGFFAGRASK